MVRETQGLKAASKQFKNVRGVTLVEMVITILILALALQYTFLLFTRGFNALRQASRQQVIVQLAQGKMEDYIEDRTIPASGNFAAKGYPTIQFTIATSVYGNPTLNLRKVTVRVWEGPKEVTLYNVVGP